MVYQSALKEGEVSETGYMVLLSQSLLKDIALQRTTAGIHRDDLQFNLSGQPFKYLASQGQRKSLLFALKLTEYEWLEAEKKHAPLLLLDDVFEKLDNNRMSNLLLEVCTQKAGQVFITDTNGQRLRSELQKTGCDFQMVDM
jgi:DNA replication and repair protein RecF